MKNLLASAAKGCGLFVCVVALSPACSTTTVGSSDVVTEPEADAESGRDRDSGLDADASLTTPVSPKDACLTYAEARCQREAVCRQNAFTLEYTTK